MTFRIEMNQHREVNNDPQRRCYNGCHASTEIIQMGWETLESEIADDKVETRLEFWRWLNDYAVSHRGKGAVTEYRAVENVL